MHEVVMVTLQGPFMETAPGATITNVPKFSMGTVPEALITFPGTFMETVLGSFIETVPGALIISVPELSMETVRDVL